MSDYFQSHTISLILTWLFSIPLILSLIFGALALLFEKTEGIPRAFMVWMVICAILFSPLRYILLQMFITIAYPFQSVHALLTTIVLALYIPIVFPILYAIGIVLPICAIVAIASFEATYSKIRLWLSALAAPVIFLIGSWLFYLVLPYAAYCTHWLDDRDVIRATNGPPEYFFHYVVEQFTPLQYPHFTDEIGWDKMTEKEVLRAHVACLYLGKGEFWYYVSKAYPDYFEKVKRKYETSQQSAVPENGP